MIHRLFLILICTSLITHAAEKSTSKLLVMEFPNDIGLTFENPFLYRFNQLRTLVLKKDTAPLTVRFDQKIRPEMGIVLRILITKPIAEIADFNMRGNYSDELFDAAQMLELCKNKNVTHFNQVFLEATIREDAVRRWCIEARKKIIDTKRLPTSCENSPLNKITILMELAVHYNREKQSSMIYEISYDTGLANTLYAHMYGRISRIIAMRPQSKKHNDIGSKEYLALIKNKLFESGAWYCYTALHGIFNSEDYDALLYGKDTITFPTRHYHVPLHDNTEEYRYEYDHDGKPLMQNEITTCYCKNVHSIGLQFKQMQTIINGCKQRVFFTYFDAILLQKIMETKKTSCLYYDLSGENREVWIAPKAVALFATFSSPLRIDLGTLSPDNATTLEGFIEQYTHIKKITMNEYTGNEYKQFHRSTPKGCIHRAIRLEKPVTKITFLDAHKNLGTQLIYATIDDSICCSCA